MDAGRAILLVVSLLTAHNWSFHIYTQVVTYRLFPLVSRMAGDEGFSRYHAAYVGRLPAVFQVPWVLLMVTSAALVAVHPVGTSALQAVVLLVLNGSIAGVSLVFAAPVHSRIAREGRLTPRDARLLQRWTTARTALATAAMALVVVMALDALA